MDIVERFIKYIKIHTTSDENSETVPSTMRQLDLAHELIDELKAFNLETRLDQGYVYTRLKSNVDHKCPTLGLIAHMDTALDYNGKGVNPRIIEKYDGSLIKLNENMSMDPEKFSGLARFIGDDIIVTDGSTLLGADDKAGISIIMDVIQTLVNNPDIKHGDIAICFTPDEEIGRGADHFDVPYFNADFAYTVDGGFANELCYETFNAYKADVHITGESIHTGSAKNKMINAISIFNEFDSLLPVNEKPEFTEGYEGFNHVYQINGSNAKLDAEYIIRNHDANIIQRQIEDFKLAEEFINKKYHRELVKVDFTLQYRNMYEILKDKKEIIDYAYHALEKVGLDVEIEAARGGTDGSRLTFMGLPCPNLGTGSINHHGPFECASINQMKTMTKVVLEMINEIRG